MRGIGVYEPVIFDAAALGAVQTSLYRGNKASVMIIVVRQCVDASNGILWRRMTTLGA